MLFLENELAESDGPSERACSLRAASTEVSARGASAEAAGRAGRGLPLVRNPAVPFAPGLRGPRGTMGAATLGQPGGKKRKLAGSSSQGERQLSRCRDVSPGPREKEEAKESTTLPSSRIGAVGLASVDAGRGRAPCTGLRAPGVSQTAALHGSWCDKCPVEDPVAKTALRQAARPPGPAVRRTWDQPIAAARPAGPRYSWNQRVGPERATPLVEQCPLGRGAPGFLGLARNPHVAQGGYWR